MKMTPGSVVGDHILLTGPIQGVVEMGDGRIVDVSPAFIEVSDDDAEEIAHRIGVRHAEEGHPNLVERDEETGEMVQRPFDYVPTQRFFAETKDLTPYGVRRKDPTTGEEALPFVHPDHAKKGAIFGVPGQE